MTFVAVKPAIPASQIASVVPSVLEAGGNALDLVGLELTTNNRAPQQSILRFATAGDVEDYFGALSVEAAHATIYFNGTDTSTKLPAFMLIAGYPLSPTFAWVRGGTLGLTLAQLQALSGPLGVSIDGVLHSASINLSASTSFSNAAESIQTALGLSGAASASVTASVGGSFTGSTQGVELIVTNVLNGVLSKGDVVSGSVGGNVIPTSTTILSQSSGVPGGIGTYIISQQATPSDLGSTTITSSSNVLDVTVLSSGTVNVGDLISGTAVAAHTYIASQLSGTVGGVGFYTLSTFNTVPSQNLNTTRPAVEYDAIIGAFVINSGSTGIGSSVTFGTGTLATSLKLTQATGAIQSPGSNATDPVTFMNWVTTQTQDWASFMTAWEPSDSDKENFSLWTNGTKNRYVYEMWDTNVLDTEVNGPGPAVAAILANTYSGTAITYEDPAIEPMGGQLAAFGMGWTASLDFSRTNGRQNIAFKSQSGLAAQVKNATEALNLLENGCNFYGDYTTANEEFIWYYQGSITGPFLWKDSYVNQIWLNNQLQLAIMVGLKNTPSIPYNLAGAALIESFLRDPINQAVNYGAIVAGVTLSAAQIAQVNRAAGVRIDNILFTQGWYVQVGQASPQVRRARTSPPCTLWYCDGGNVQQITLASIEVQ